jgi:2'-hydroxyisoflavone reductase
MRVLILGGTSFVGRAIAGAAMESGFDVSLFNRGRSPAPAFPSRAALPRLIGDRDTGDYAALRDGPAWDAVVDVNGYFPRHVAGAMDALGDRAGRYLFISSHAVFAGGSDARRAAIRDAGPPLTDATYGPSKVACEDDVLARYGDRATIVRPGKVAGPYDNQDGLTYWVRRAAGGGRIALPTDSRPPSRAAGTQPVQVVDSRDLARFVARLIADDRPGAFTAVGTSTPIAEVVAVCAAAAGTSVELVPVPYEAAPRPFPLVKAAADWPTQRRDPGPARAAGLPVTDLAVTAADVLAWDRERGEPPLDRGFTAAQESRLLSV